MKVYIFYADNRQIIDGYSYGYHDIAVSFSKSQNQFEEDYDLIASVETWDELFKVFEDKGFDYDYFYEYIERDISHYMYSILESQSNKKS